MKTIAIIVSAGKGKRLKSKIPKQYLKICGKPILFYTLDAFNKSPFIDGIILAVAADKINFCRKLAKESNFKKVLDVMAGGEERSNSVYNGLKKLPEDTGIVVVHDGVRPLVSQRLIKEVVSNAKKYGSAISALPPKNTIKEVSGNSIVKKTLVRSSLVEVQTPQAFRRDIIESCYEKFKDKLGNVTDDSSLVECAGFKVKIVNGDYENIKITTADDIMLLRSIIGEKDSKGIDAVGVGYDIHRLVKGRRLVLGGVNIPSALGLLGHSDADVLLHAIADAIFGAIGERDIGWHFSNRDPKFKGMPSKYFILEAKKIAERKKFKIANIDSIIVAQEPKLQPYYSEMVSNISDWLNLPKSDVTVKFTTPEEVGPLGAKKAIAGMAIAGVTKI